MSKHWDMWGTPILEFFEMKKRYQNDPVSTEVLRRAVPCMYVVLPTVSITVDKKDPRCVTVEYIYPVERTFKRIEASERTLRALRAMYKSLKPGWKKSETDKAVTFTRAGRLHVPGFQKYGFTIGNDNAKRSQHANGR